MIIRGLVHPFGLALYPLVAVAPPTAVVCSSTRPVIRGVDIPAITIPPALGLIDALAGRESVGRCLGLEPGIRLAPDAIAGAVFSVLCILLVPRHEAVECSSVAQARLLRVVSVMSPIITGALTAILPLKRSAPSWPKLFLGFTVLQPSVSFSPSRRLKFAFRPSRKRSPASLSIFRGRNPESVSGIALFVLVGIKGTLRSSQRGTTECRPRCPKASHRSIFGTYMSGDILSA